MSFFLINLGGIKLSTNILRDESSRIIKQLSLRKSYVEYEKKSFPSYKPNQLIGIFCMKKAIFEWSLRESCLITRVDSPLKILALDTQFYSR